jgi:hypothetical protein
MAVAAVLLQTLVSDAATTIALCAGMFAIFFCIGGCATTLYRMYVVLPGARRLVARGDDEATAIQLRRSLPPNSSVVFQAAVGLLAAVMVAVTA